MNTIGFITSPLTSGHAVRGVGFYTKNLLEHLHPLSAEYGLQIIECPNYELRTMNYELVHFPFFDLFTRTLPVIHRQPTVVTVHDVIPLEYPEIYQLGIQAKINLGLQKIALAGAKHIITDSLASKKNIIALLGINPKRVTPVLLAAGENFHRVTNSTTLTAIRSKYHLPQKFVLYVGDINWNKNLPSLVAACNELKYPLVLVGKRLLEVEHLDYLHPEHVHLKNLADLLAKPGISRLGFVPDEDISAIYSLATIYCQPSFAEGFGLPVLEAFACGTPVITSHTHSLIEVGGEAVLYFDPLKPADLPLKLTQLWQNSRLRTDLVQKGYLQLRKFSWEKAARETLQVYSDVISQNI